MRSPLAKFTHLMQDPNPDGAREFCRKLWLDHGILVVMPAKVGWVEAVRAKQMAEELYGKRRE